MIEFIQNNSEQLAEVCKKHHVKKMSLFGSASKDSFTEDSDIDLLVLFSSELEVLEYADNYFSLLEELQRLFGRRVDLLSTKSLKNAALKEAIFSSKIDLYAA